MRKTKRLAMIAIVTLAALTLILTFRPKQWVIGGLVGGPSRPTPQPIVKSTSALASS